MLTRPYGRTGKNISAISFGGMRFPKEAGQEANAELLPYALERGVNYFDTAPGYDDSEDIFGIAFKQMDRDAFYVSTKAWQADGDELRKVLEKSLQRMGLQKVDFFHIWCVVSMDAWQERIAGGAVAAAMKAKEEGLIDHVVISSHLQGDDLAGVLKEGHFEGVTLGYNAINFPYRQAALDAAAELDLGVVTMNPLGGGLIPQNSERFGFLCGREDTSTVQAALRFNLSSPAVTSALVGFSTKDQIDEAVAAAENFQPYPPERIEQIREHILETFNDLCTGCGYCLPCPFDVEIPKLMDAYNHMILGEGKPEAIVNRLNWHWNLTPAAAEACTLCGACETKCTQHLPICERMKEIAQIAKDQQAADQKEKKED